MNPLSSQEYTTYPDTAYESQDERPGAISPSLSLETKIWHTIIAAVCTIHEYIHGQTLSKKWEGGNFKMKDQCMYYQPSLVK